MKKGQGPTGLFRTAAWGRVTAGVGGVCLLKGAFAPAYICSDIAAIGPWTDQGTAHSAR